MAINYQKIRRQIFLENLIWIMCETCEVMYNS